MPFAQNENPSPQEMETRTQPAADNPRPVKTLADELKEIEADHPAVAALLKRLHDFVSKFAPPTA